MYTAPSPLVFDKTLHQFSRQRVGIIALFGTQAVFHKKGVLFEEPFVIPFVLPGYGMDVPGKEHEVADVVGVRYPVFVPSLVPYPPQDVVDIPARAPSYLARGEVVGAEAEMLHVNFSMFHHMSFVMQ